ncbi:ATP-dependent DNA helicase RecG [Pelodictyon luteolum]|uniref:ATP-dependent DNA helicase RecG n=1 Tax=Chlorobium luteolum (strain DSM 273 / BCRC 81028 / 2530) TaxID=319225 RepID=Q3B5Z3_CHLL3|nr:ATP-dependent DNA helicase RecG [Pelodictyon luteolum]ABB23238.1 ATP-dependent DNA helicase RecG [Pelodictyon luteolum DSM 273]
MAESSPLSSLKGMGPKKVAILHDAGLVSFEDLFELFPRRYLDRRVMKPVRDLRAGETATVVGTITAASVDAGQRGRSRFRATLSDGSGTLELTWFRGVRYFARAVVPGETLAVHGKVGYFGARAQMQHPDFDRLGSDRHEDGGSDLSLYNTGRIIPLYPTTEAMKLSGLGSRQLRSLMAQAFELQPPGARENLSRSILDSNSLMPLAEAYREIHFPSSPERLGIAERRMKWTELFYAQLLFALRRHTARHLRQAAVFTHSGEYTSRLYASLPYELTAAQKDAIREIYRDLRSGSPMQRLLQGDVGSGKTAVAMFSMALAADNKLQSVFMAPTEILAVQHWLSMRRFFEPLGLEVALFSGRQPKRLREELLLRLREGDVHVAVGTHALIEDAVRYRELGLVIIDEQHRFGVLQRKALQEKASNPHVLLMTATPIPRTLTMGVFGDLDVSVIRQMPAGRRPVKTIVRPESEQAKVHQFLRREIADGHQGYIVYPLVEASEKTDLQAAVESFGELSGAVFPDLRLGLIHGQMSPEEKDGVMQRFRTGELHILVGTTVIEVGVDVPNATVIIVEHAERFGLAQLHQLRGRVGRGQHPSHCFLLYGKLTGDGRERLQAMESTSDGFVISEMDARIRGAGNVLGKEQSGSLSGLKIADLSLDFDIMQSARSAAFALVEADSRLALPENEPVRRWYMDRYLGRQTLADIG